MQEIIAIALLCLAQNPDIQAKCQKYFVECLPKKTLEQCVVDRPLNDKPTR